MSSTERRSLQIWFQRVSLLSALCLPAAAEARPKSDTIVVKNGDRIRGEIESLKYGELRLSTDSMGSVLVEWPDVRAIYSPFEFTIEGVHGEVLTGSLSMSSDSSKVVVRGARDTTEILLTDIAGFAQLENGFWKRVDGNVSFGFTYEKATDISLLKFRFDTRYQNPRMASALNASADLSNTDGGDSQENMSAGYNLRWLRGRSAFWIGGVSWQRNEELGIASRLQAAAGRGRYLMRGLDTEVSAYIGLGANQEWVFGTSDATLSGEALIGADWRTFRFRDPETSVFSTLMVLPSLTESGRIRVDFNITASREIISDLTIDLSYFLDTDSKPPADAEKTDTGVGLTIGYKF